MQFDNPTHRNPKKDKIQALEALQKAKSLNKTIKVLPKGYCIEFEKLKLQISKRKL